MEEQEQAIEDQLVPQTAFPAFSPPSPSPQFNEVLLSGTLLLVERHKSKNKTVTKEVHVQFGTTNSEADISGTESSYLLKVRRASIIGGVTPVVISATDSSTQSGSKSYTSYQPPESLQRDVSVLLDSETFHGVVVSPWVTGLKEGDVDANKVSASESPCLALFVHNRKSRQDECYVFLEVGGGGGGWGKPSQTVDGGGKKSSAVMCWYTFMKQKIIVNPTDYRSLQVRVIRNMTAGYVQFLHMTRHSLTLTPRQLGEASFLRLTETYQRWPLTALSKAKASVCKKFLKVEFGRSGASEPCTFELIDINVKADGVTAALDEWKKSLTSPKRVRKASQGKLPVSPRVGLRGREPPPVPIRCDIPLDQQRQAAGTQQPQEQSRTDSAYVVSYCDADESEPLLLKDLSPDNAKELALDYEDTLGCKRMGKACRLMKEDSYEAPLLKGHSSFLQLGSSPKLKTVDLPPVSVCQGSLTERSPEAIQRLPLVSPPAIHRYTPEPSSINQGLACAPSKLGLRPSLPPVPGRKCKLPDCEPPPKSSVRKSATPQSPQPPSTPPLSVSELPHTNIKGRKEDNNNDDEDSSDDSDDDQTKLYDSYRNLEVKEIATLVTEPVQSEVTLTGPVVQIRKPLRSVSKDGGGDTIPATMDDLVRRGLTLRRPPAPAYTQWKLKCKEQKEGTIHTVSATSSTVNVTRGEWNTVSPNSMENKATVSDPKEFNSMKNKTTVGDPKDAEESDVSITEIAADNITHASVGEDVPLLKTSSPQRASSVGTSAVTRPPRVPLKPTTLPRNCRGLKQGKQEEKRQPYENIKTSIKTKEIASHDDPCRSWTEDDFHKISHEPGWTPNVYDTITRIARRLPPPGGDMFHMGITLRPRFCWRLHLAGGGDVASWQSLADAVFELDTGTASAIETFCEQFRLPAPEVVLHHWQLLFSADPALTYFPPSSGSLLDVLRQIGRPDLCLELERGLGVKKQSLRRRHGRRTNTKAHESCSSA